MVCQVYTVPTNKAYISVKFGASPGKPRMFLCSYNVAGDVFKSKTDGGGEGLVLLWTVPLLTQKLYKPEHLQPVPLCNIRTFFPVSIHLLERKCSWFLLPSGLCGYSKNWPIRQNPRGPDPSWILWKKHTTTSGRQCFDCSSQHQEQSVARATSKFCVATATVYQKHTHTRTDTHTISSCPDIYANHWGGKEKSWLTCAGQETAWSLKRRRMVQYSEVRDGWLLPKGALLRE